MEVEYELFTRMMGVMHHGFPSITFTYDQLSEYYPAGNPDHIQPVDAVDFEKLLSDMKLFPIDFTNDEYRHRATFTLSSR